MDDSDSKVFSTTEDDSVLCAVCIQKSELPTLLPCGHVFCFLCVKGLGRNDRRCALCRQEFPAELMLKPHLLKPVEELPIASHQQEHQWFYEGRNGWWQYEKRCGDELEDAFQAGQTTYELFVSGDAYVVDFQNMVQRNRRHPSRCRRIKRDTADAAKKGVCGIRNPKIDEGMEMGIAMLNLFGPSE